MLPSSHFCTTKGDTSMLSEIVVALWLFILDNADNAATTNDGGWDTHGDRTGK
jgi:hypothetical protein